MSGKTSASGSKRKLSSGKVLKLQRRKDPEGNHGQVLQLKALLKPHCTELLSDCAFPTALAAYLTLTGPHIDYGAQEGVCYLPKSQRTNRNRRIRLDRRHPINLRLRMKRLMDQYVTSPA